MSFGSLVDDFKAVLHGKLEELETAAEAEEDAIRAAVSNTKSKVLADLEAAEPEVKAAGLKAAEDIEEAVQAVLTTFAQSRRL